MESIMKENLSDKSEIMEWVERGVDINKLMTHFKGVLGGKGTIIIFLQQDNLIMRTNVSILQILLMINQRAIAKWVY